MPSELRRAREAKYLGKRIRAVWFSTVNSSIDDNETVPPGTEGVVKFVDDFGTLATDWENGSTLGVLPQDDVELVEEAG